VVKGVAHLEDARMGLTRLQRLVYVYVPLAVLRIIALHVQFNLDAHATADGWNPVDTLLNDAMGREVHRPKPVDRRERYADAEVGPGELYHHV
jgi:hypothetical protein